MSLIDFLQNCGRNLHMHVNFAFFLSQCWQFVECMRQVVAYIGRLLAASHLGVLGGI